MTAELVGWALPMALRQALIKGSAIIDTHHRAQYMADEYGKPAERMLIKAINERERKLL